jgi:arsenate reductase (thioredoxin)
MTSEMTAKKKVLILCTGNSCRSQMAEAMINHYLGHQWQAFSAGTQPSGYVHPLAIKALAEIGIQHSGESKSAQVFRDENFDVVITVCDDAAENCPVWLGNGKQAPQRVHIGFIDPAKAQGSEEEQMLVFRHVRDEMRSQILAYLEAFPKIKETM